MRLNQLSKHFCHSDWGISKTCILNASTASSGVEKRWPLILYTLYYGNKKKLFGGKSRLYCGWLIKSMFWVLENAVVCADVWELALSWWKVIPLRRLVFLISWKTTGKQMVVYHSELTVLRHLLESTSCVSNFCWIWLILKHPYSRLLFTLGLIRIYVRFITCYDVIDRIFRAFL